MILSNDRTKVFFEVTKTGSNTMRSLLLPNLGTDLLGGSAHATRNWLTDIYRQQINQDATQEEIDAIEGYAFWRDPVDRFKSQVSFSRQFPEALGRLFPEHFGPGAPYDLTTFNLPKRLTRADYDNLPKRWRDQISTFITSELFYERIRDKLMINLVTYPQSWWFVGGRITALNYHDFDNEAKRLITLFGGDPNVTIPVLNASDDFLPSITIPPQLEEWIRDLYSQDYNFDPRVEHTVP